MQLVFLAVRIGYRLEAKGAESNHSMAHQRCTRNHRWCPFTARALEPAGRGQTGHVLSKCCGGRGAEHGANPDRSAAATVFLMTAACAPTHNTVIKNVPNQVALADSEYHAFEYVSVKEDDGQPRVYGKIEHDHRVCRDEGHVDLAVLGASGRLAYSKSLPLRRQSQRVCGWAGAAFRAVLPYRLEAGDSVRLAFHDDDYLTEAPFECGDNRATGGTTKP